MSVLDEKLLNEIDAAKERIDGCRLDAFVQNMLLNLQKEAIAFSSIQDADNEARKEDVIRDFEQAWNYACGSFEGDFSIHFMKELAGKVEPGLKQGKRVAKFRDGCVTLKNLGYVAPIDRARIEMHLDRVESAVNNLELHPVEESVLRYFHIGRIQPFDNGNKRTAAIIMNSILRYNQYPSVYFKPGERNIFASLLISSIREFQNVDSNSDDRLEAYSNPNFQQKALFEYMGNKVLSNLIASEDKLQFLPKYRVTIKKPNSPGQVFSAKRKIDCGLRKGGTLYTLHVNRGSKDAYIDVVGHITYEVLEKLVSSVNNISFNIKTK